MSDVKITPYTAAWYANYDFVFRALKNCDKEKNKRRKAERQDSSAEKSE